MQELLSYKFSSLRAAGISSAVSPLFLSLLCVCERCAADAPRPAASMDPLCHQLADRRSSSEYASIVQRPFSGCTEAAGRFLYLGMGSLFFESPLQRWDRGFTIWERLPYFGRHFSYLCSKNNNLCALFLRVFDKKITDSQNRREKTAPGGLCRRERSAVRFQGISGILAPGRDPPHRG